MKCDLKMKPVKEKIPFEEDEEEEEDLESEEEIEAEEEAEAEEEEMEADEEAEEPEPEICRGLPDDTELIDLIIDQNETGRRIYTDIQVTAATMKRYNTYPYLTKYEKARVLGLRAEQLGRNAPPLVTPVKGASDHAIAWQEVLAGRCPWIIARPLPNGTRLLISVNLLKIL